MTVEPGVPTNAPFPLTRNAHAAEINTKFLQCHNVSVMVQDRPDQFFMFRVEGVKG
jgi:hypothetical protein